MNDRIPRIYDEKYEQAYSLARVITWEKLSTKTIKVWLDYTSKSELFSCWLIIVMESFHQIQRNNISVDAIDVD